VFSGDPMQPSRKTLKRLTFGAVPVTVTWLNDFGYSARQDVLAAVDWLEHNHFGRPVVVWSQSLGAAAAPAVGRRRSCCVPGCRLGFCGQLSDEVTAGWTEPAARRIRRRSPSPPNTSDHCAVTLPSPEDCSPVRTLAGLPVGPSTLAPVVLPALASGR
jgi:hypothetical protein